VTVRLTTPLLSGGASGNDRIRRIADVLRRATPAAGRDARPGNIPGEIIDREERARSLRGRHGIQIEVGAVPENCGFDRR